MFRKIFITTITFFTLLLFSQNSNAQQRFRAGLTAGVNLSQIQGDKTGGYNKMGLVGGLRVLTLLTEKSDLSVELLFSQRGSRNDKSEPFIIQIDLNYVEVPFTYNYKDWYDEEGDYYKVQATGGFAFSRLLDATHEDSTGKPVDMTGDFNTNDVGIVLGAEFFFSKHWSISGRWTSSFNKLSNAENSPTSTELRGYFLSFRTNYIF